MQNFELQLTDDAQNNDLVTGEFDGYGFPHSTRLKNCLKENFGIVNFRTNQLQVINAALMGNNCFVLMPTGAGKSVCYQLPALLNRGITLVISPLKSLIIDQVNKLQSLNIEANHLCGAMNSTHCKTICKRLRLSAPTIKLLYLTPEKLFSSKVVRNLLQQLHTKKYLARIVIDEAHCVSEWGHDFRPQYKRLNELRNTFPHVPIMALTATASPRVRANVMQILNLHNCKRFLGSSNRSNLEYVVKAKHSARATIAHIVDTVKTAKNASAIVYCLSHKECEDVASKLSEFGIKAGFYHAGLNDDDREEMQSKWTSEHIKIICATVAFGMGIDKANVRFVFHYSMP